MTEHQSKWLVETDWLASRLDAPDLVVLDASLHLPDTGRNPKAEFLAAHIPGALFFDIDDISDEKNPLPHMLPSAAKFASRMKKMGVGDGMRVVVYDSEGLYSAARAWWMFRIMGHDDVAVLNGGLKKWKAEGRPLEDGEPRRRTERHFTPRFHAELVRDAAEVKALIGDKTTQIVDARAAGRFEGRDPDPRPGLRKGHIPSSRNVPFATLLNPDGTLKPAAELRRHLRQGRRRHRQAGGRHLRLRRHRRRRGAGAGAAGAAGRRRLRRLVGGVGRREQRPARGHRPGTAVGLQTRQTRGPAGLRSKSCERLVELGEVGAPLRPVGGDAVEPRDDGAAALQQLARLAVVAAKRFQRADLVIADGQIALPGRPGRIDRCQRLRDLEPAPVGGHRLVHLALGVQDIADAVEADREIPLPLPAFGLAPHQRFGNRESGAKARQRAVEVALALQHLADAIVRDGKVALPAGIGGIARGQRLGNREAAPAALERQVQLASGEKRCRRCDRA